MLIADVVESLQVRAELALYDDPGVSHSASVGGGRAPVAKARRCGLLVACPFERECARNGGANDSALSLRAGSASAGEWLIAAAAAGVVPAVALFSRAAIEWGPGADCEMPPRKRPCASPDVGSLGQCRRSRRLDSDHGGETSGRGPTYRRLSANSAWENGMRRQPGVAAVLGGQPNAA